MTEYKSEVKKIYAPIGRVYERLADLNNLAVIQQGLDNPEAMERIKQQAGDKVSPEQLEQVVEKLRSLEREPEKTIKFAAEGIPVAANMWIQLLPQSENECAMRLTVKADLNFFIRQMVGKKLEQGVDGLAQMLASLPY